MRAEIIRPGERTTGVPRLAWVRILLLALGLFAGAVGGLEGYWRSQGLRPSVPDDTNLWRFWRTRVYEPRGKVVVFLGTSRIRSDIDLQTLATRAPTFRSVQLGVNGDVSPLGTLRSLALDPRFRGVVVCELASPFLPRSRWNDQREFFDRPAGSVAFDRLVYAYLRDQSVVLLPRVTLSSSVQHFLAGEPWPRLARSRAVFDRSVQYDDAVTRVPLDDRLQLAEQKPVEPQLALEGLKDLREIVQRIQSRHGAVVFVRLPASAPSVATTESGFTGTLDWKRIAEVTGAVCISLDTGDSLGPFHCRDGVHLDPAQAKRLTERLVAELHGNRLLE